MPWVKIGRFRFDLNRVVLITQAVKNEESDGTPSITVTLRFGPPVDLKGEDANVFLAMHDEHVASRSVGRPPPVVGEPMPPGHKSKGPSLPPSGPEHPGGVKEAGFLGGDRSPDREKAETVGGHARTSRT